MTLYSFRNSVIPDLVGEQQLNIAKRAATRKLLKKYSTPELTEAEKVQQQQVVPTSFNYNEDDDKIFLDITNKVNLSTEYAINLSDALFPHADWQSKNIKYTPEFLGKTRTGRKQTPIPTEKFLGKKLQNKQTEELKALEQKMKLETQKKRDVYLLLNKEHDRLKQIEQEITRKKEELKQKENDLVDENDKIQEFMKRDENMSQYLIDEENKNKEEYRNLLKQKEEAEKSIVSYLTSSQIKKIDEAIVANNEDRMLLKKQRAGYIERRAQQKALIEAYNKKIRKVNKEKSKLTEKIRKYDTDIYKLRDTQEYELKKIDTDVPKVEQEFKQKLSEYKKEMDVTTSSESTIINSSTVFIFFQKALNKLITNNNEVNRLLKLNIKNINNISLETFNLFYEAISRFTKEMNKLYAALYDSKGEIKIKKFYGYTELKKQELYKKFNTIVETIKEIDYTLTGIEEIYTNFKNTYNMQTKGAGY